MKKLGEVCNFDKRPNQKINLPYVGLEHIESDSGKFIGSTTPQSVKSLTFYFTHEHVLYGRLRPYLNKVLLPNFEGHCSTEIFPIKVSKELDKNFLFHWLLSDKTANKINATCTGARMPRANMNAVLEFKIPIPPLAEQQRIVAILDKAFAAIATAKGYAERNLQNSKELFQSYLHNVFANKGEGWEEKKLGDVCEIRNGQAHEQHIIEDGKYILINSKFISSNAEKYKRTNDALSPLYKGDIVFVMSDVPNGKALAKCFLVDKDDTYTLNQRICVIRSKQFDKMFLYYQLDRHKYLLSFNNGENQTNLRKNNILKCPLFIPSVKEQQTIVAKLDALSEQTKKLESIYRLKIADLEELKKSILWKAFDGDL